MNKHFILTGASSGLGKEFALYALEQGDHITALSRTKPDYACTHISVDLGDPSDIEKAAEAVISQGEKFDALVNCAGVLAVTPVNEPDYKAAEDLMKINVLAPIHLTGCLFDRIKECEADVLNVGSTTGTKAYEEQAAYGASKWALRGISENIRLELKGTACRVMQMNPGGMKTPIFERAFGRPIDMSSLMEPADLAKIMYFVLTLPKNMEMSEFIVNRK